MSLDISFMESEPVRCPHCGEIVTTKTINGSESGGRVWYDILEEIGYYVPYEKRTDENDWYGKDMVLTSEQAEKVYWFVMNHREIIYNGYEVSGLIARALMNKNAVVINADW